METTEKKYTVENALKFKWASVNGNLNTSRVTYLSDYLIGTKILDAGCGGGAYVEFLSNQSPLKVTGVDKYKQFLAMKPDKSIGTYVQGDITALPFPDKNFDCTYCFDVLEHIDDRAGIKELSRVTSKRLILTVPKEDNVLPNFGLTFLHYQDKTHLRNYTETSFKKLCSGINYKSIIIFPELPVSISNIARASLDFKKSNLITRFCYRKLFHHLLKKTSSEVYTGLVAVITL